MVEIVDRITHKIPWLRHTGQLNIPDDLEVEGAELHYHHGNLLDYILLHVIEREAGKEYLGYRVIRLMQLRYISLEARRDAGLLQKMRTVLRGLYSARINLVYLAAGIFEEPKVGIIQCYGVSSFSDDRDTAVKRSLESLVALKAGLVGAYRQMRLDPLPIDIAEWISKALLQMPYAIVVVGHPDPRENARGGDAALHDPLAAGNLGSQQFSMQQNELLFRGISSLEEEFLFMLLAEHISLADITRMLVGLSEEISIFASRQTGVRAASFGISLPAILTGGLAENASRSYGTNHSTGVTESQGATDGVANSVGQAHTIGHASTSGWAHTVGVAETDSTGSAKTSGTAHTTGEAVTDGTAVTDGSSHTEGSSVTVGSSHTESSGMASSHSDSNNYGVNGGLGGSVAPAGVGVSGNVGGNAGWGSSDGVTNSSGVSDSSMFSSSASESSTTSHAETQSHSVTQSASDTTSQANTVSKSHSTTNSEAWTTSGAETDSVADTDSSSTTNSHADSVSKSQSESNGTGIGQMIGRGISSGMSVGVAPSFSLSNSYQWQDDPFILLTDILRIQRKLLDMASLEGAFYTDVYALARSEQGAQALMGLIPEAFHGTEDVVVGVQTRKLTQAEQAYIGLHARAFTPSTRIETIPEAMSGYADSTMLTMLQVAAYTAPGMFEQGSALTIQEETPSFAFYPDSPGNIALAWQWSSETGMLTNTLLKLAPARHFHTAFIGDTGFGKSIAAERLAYETTRYWHYRTIVLDFGQGWRKALNWPGLNGHDLEDSHGHVDILQLYPGSPRPLRWNILQVPKRIDPGRYRSMVAELFANAGRMGPRQLGLLRRALTEIYSEAGVLTGDPKLQNGEMGCLLNNQEVEIVKRARSDNELSADDIRVGSKLERLNPVDLQALAVYRSQTLDVSEWVERLRSYQKEFERDQATRTSLEGVLLRLEQFAEGQMARQYGPSKRSKSVEDLGLLGDGGNPWGITVIEGGAEMDEFPKAALLSLLASILYFDAIARRREGLDGKRHFPPMQIFFEEANKVLTGVSGGAASDQSGGDSGNPVSHIFQTMWRDGRKYSIFLHLIAQTVSDLPSGILSSCANLYTFQTKDPKDRDIVLPHLGKSEKGLVNTEYKRYLARIPRTYAIMKLGYSDDVHQLEPILVRPMIIQCDEPSDQKIIQTLGRVLIGSNPGRSFLRGNARRPVIKHPYIIEGVQIKIYANEKTFPFYRNCSGCSYRSFSDCFIKWRDPADSGGGCQGSYCPGHNFDG